MPYSGMVQQGQEFISDKVIGKEDTLETQYSVCLFLDSPRVPYVPKVAKTPGRAEARLPHPDLFRRGREAGSSLSFSYRWPFAHASPPQLKCFPSFFP